LTKKLGVAIVGCGNIADAYAENLITYPQIDLIGAADLDVQRAKDLAAKFGCHAYPSVDDLLTDEKIDIVANLTIHHAHKEVTTQCLQAGKHVHSEKPLALTHEDAQGLVDLANEQGLRLGCSPFTFMGEGQQTAWKVIRAGRLGPIRVAYAEVNWGRLEAWHPNPGPFYQVGPFFDVGVYPLTLLTAIFGPARRVSAYGTVLHPNRVTKEGTPFHINTPDFVVAMIELANGTLLRITTNFYVGFHTKQSPGVEFHGDIGSLYLSNWHNFDGTVEFAEFGREYQPVSWVKEPYKGPRGVEWGRAILDMAEAIVQDRPHRATGEQAAHVVEILEAITRSMEHKQPIAIHSDFTSPTPMEWAIE
jgi:predicted dehydrogenase